MTHTKLASATVLALILFATAVTSAEARVRHQQSDLPSFDRHALAHVGSEALIAERAQRHRHAGLKQIRKRMARSKSASMRHRPGTPEQHRERAGSAVAQIVAHPVGCPARAFCGCGASIEVFGKSIRELWLASAWFKFPRAEPAPGMVAVRRHHVFVIREVRGPGLVLAYDANSGGRQTRIHLRSLRGFVVVNPRGGSRYATAG